MKYNFDEKETIKLKQQISDLQKKIESAVISQQYKKASSLKAKQINIEEKISELKQKFSIPKDERLNVSEQDIWKVISISTGIPIDNFSCTEINKLKSLPINLKKQII